MKPKRHAGFSVAVFATAFLLEFLIVYNLVSFFT